MAFLVFWVGAQLAGSVVTPHHEHNDFTIGRKRMLCGYVVDERHEVSGYEYNTWTGSRCEEMSDLDECMLECLSRAGTIQIGAACYPDCVADQ